MRRKRRPGAERTPRIAAAGQAALESIRSENRAAAARLRACHALYTACWQEEEDRDIAALSAADGGGHPPAHAVIDPFDVACAELVAVYGIHQNRAAAMLELATRMVTTFPAMIDAMESGRLDERTASMLVRQMRTVDSRFVADVQQAVIDWLMAAIDSGARPGRQAILAETDRIIEEHDPEGVLLRREEALRDRNVQIRRGIDGMSDLHAYLSTPEAQAIYDTLQKAALQGKDNATAAGSGETVSGDAPYRGIGEYRADALVDALLGPADLSTADHDPAADHPAAGHAPAADPGRTTAPAGPSPHDPGPAFPRIRPIITVLMPRTPLGEPEVYLPRGGPASIDALISLLSRSVGATIAVADPEPGAADTESGARRYRISADLARRVRLRDGTCRHPGCSVSAEACDVDHVRPFSHSDPENGGLTVESNLMCLCRNHHRFKTFYNWRYHLSRDGTLTLTTDTGHTITTEPTGPLALWRRLGAYGGVAGQPGPSTCDESEPHETHRTHGADATDAGDGADAANTADDAHDPHDTRDEPDPGTLPWLAPIARSTRWHRRIKRLAAERRANATRRASPPARPPDRVNRTPKDPDPPPF